MTLKMPGSRAWRGGVDGGMTGALIVLAGDDPGHARLNQYEAAAAMRA
jgi:hypothetical protein